MAVFQYVAIDSQGSEVRGQLDAPDANSAAADLRGQSLFVTRLHAGSNAATPTFEQNGSGEQTAVATRGLAWYLPVTRQDRTFFLQQMALMLRSGLTLLQALEVCRDHTRKRRLAVCIGQMIADIQDGKSLSQAMTDQKRLFTNLTAKLVESAEASGELDATLDQAARTLTQQAELKAKLLTSLIYPAVVVFTAVGVSIFLVIKVIPKFASFLSRRQGKLPWTTQTLLDLSGYARQYGLPVLAVTVVLAIAVGFTYTTARGRLALDRAILRVPFVGGLLSIGAMIQLTRTLALLLNSGLTLLGSLQIVSNVIGNRAIAVNVAGAADKILRGQDLAGSLRNPVVPTLVTQVVAVGERTGTLSHVLRELSEFYDQQLQQSLQRMVALIEPVVILFIGGMVFFVYVSFFDVVFKLATGGH